MPLKIQLIAIGLGVLLLVGVTAGVSALSDGSAQQPASSASDSVVIPLPSDAFNGDPNLQGAVQKMLEGPSAESPQPSAPNNPLQPAAENLQAP